MSESTPLPEPLPLADPAVRAVLDALRGPGTEAELAGESATVAAFVAAQAGAALPPPRRKSVLSTFLASKVAIATAVSAVAVGGTAAAAYTGSLPSSLQEIAHETIGAPGSGPSTPDSEVDGDHTIPAEHRSDAPTPRGPKLDGPAAIGLCNAFEHGGLATTSTAYANLERAAGAKERIKEFCDDVRRTGHHPEATESSKEHHGGMGGGMPSGMPSEHPSTMPGGHPSDTPSSMPSTMPSGYPSTAPGGQPSGSPGGHQGGGMGGGMGGGQVPTPFPTP